MTDVHFNSTATGVLGEKRETMLDNQLLLRPELGKPLARGYNVPGEGFTYGRPNAVKDGGTAEAMTGWSGTISLPLPKIRKNRTERDFMSLNRAAVLMGLTTAPEQYQFRATHDVRRKISDEDKTRNRTRRIPPSMVFGISTRPSTPVFDLLENKYQDQWLQQRRSSEIARREREQTNKSTTGKIYETRATLLRTYQNPVDPPALWQMSKFTKAKRHLETFRSTPARNAAFKNHVDDGVSKRGLQNHGIYEPAKN